MLSKEQADATMALWYEFEAGESQCSESSVTCCAIVPGLVTYFQEAFLQNVAILQQGPKRGLLVVPTASAQGLQLWSL